jgi:DNA gyrase inhibitor GyrI
MKETINYRTNIRETPTIRVAALSHRGDYNQIAATFEQLAEIAAGMNLSRPATRSFAIYYDDPSATPATRFDPMPVLPYRRTGRRAAGLSCARFAAGAMPSLCTSAPTPS